MGRPGKGGPGEWDPQLGKAELEQLELAKVLVQEVAPGDVRAGRATQGVLSRAVQQRELVRVAVRRLAILPRDDALQVRPKVDVGRHLARDCSSGGSVASAAESRHKDSLRSPLLHPGGRSSQIRQPRPANTVHSARSFAAWGGGTTMRHLGSIALARTATYRR